LLTDIVNVYNTIYVLCIFDLFVCQLYLQAFLSEQKHYPIDKISRDPMVEYYFVSMNKPVGRDRPIWIPQHELERVIESLFSAFGHNGVPGYRVQIVLCQIINRD